MDEATDSDVEGALEDEYRTVGNVDLVTDTLMELNRVDVTELDSDETAAYADVIAGLSWLRESLREPERRPNAKVQEPYEVTDD